MSEEEASKEHDAPSPPEPDEPPTISWTKLWANIKQQPLQEKLFFWGALVYVCATFLDWSGVSGIYWIAWDLGFLSVAANLVVLAGLLVQAGGLAGIGPGGTSTQWLRIYRYAAMAPPVVLIYSLVRGARGFGAWIALLALAVNLYALYRILEGKKLLPIRFTR